MSLRAVAVGNLILREFEIPVKLFLAADSDSKSVELRQVHAQCASKTENRLYCPACAREIDRPTEAGKAIENGEDLILVNQGDLESLAAPTDHRFEVRYFFPANHFDPLMFAGKSYFVGIDSEKPRDAYRLLWTALLGRGQGGLVQFNLYGRESYAVLMVDAVRGLLVLHMLRYRDEIRSVAEVPVAEPRKVDSDLLELTDRVIKSMCLKPFNPADLIDLHLERITEFIELKKSAQSAPANRRKSEPRSPSSSADLVTSLKASIRRARA